MNDLLGRRHTGEGGHRIGHGPGVLRFVATWFLGSSKVYIRASVCCDSEIFFHRFGSSELTETWHLPLATLLLESVLSVVPSYLNWNLPGEGGGGPLAKIQISRPPQIQRMWERLKALI